MSGLNHLSHGGEFGDDGKSYKNLGYNREASGYIYEVTNADGSVYQNKSRFGPQGIQADYTIESMLIPIGQGLKFLGRGLGILGSQSKSVVMGGASKSINYYTQKAVKAGFSSTLKGTNVKAGAFVQANHNFSRLFRSNFNGRWKTLYSNSPASIQGRYWQNQAIGIGASSVGVGAYATYSGLNNK